MTEFEPRIIAFLCNWCSYRGADLAGTSRVQYPANVRDIRVMCTGSINSVSIIEAFLNGVDGVLIAGCHLGDCHYQDGNYKAKRRIELLKNILREVGIDEDRLWLRWISASEGGLFSETIREMVAHLKAKGPCPIQKPSQVWQQTVGSRQTGVESEPDE